MLSIILFGPHTDRFNVENDLHADKRFNIVSEIISGHFNVSESAYHMTADAKKARQGKQEADGGGDCFSLN